MLRQSWRTNTLFIFSTSVGVERALELYQIWLHLVAGGLRKFNASDAYASGYPGAVSLARSG